MAFGATGGVVRNFSTAVPQADQGNSGFRYNALTNSYDNLNPVAAPPPPAPPPPPPAPTYTPPPQPSYQSAPSPAPRQQDPAPQPAPQAPPPPQQQQQTAAPPSLLAPMMADTPPGPGWMTTGPGALNPNLGKSLPRPSIQALASLGAKGAY